MSGWWIYQGDSSLHWVMWCW